LALWTTVVPTVTGFVVDGRVPWKGTGIVARK